MIFREFKRLALSIAILLAISSYCLPATTGPGQTTPPLGFDQIPAPIIESRESGRFKVALAGSTIPGGSGGGDTKALSSNDRVSRAAVPVKDISNFTESPWFSLVTGLASVVGLLLSLYPIQIRSLPPSVFRSLLWQRALLLAFGCGLSVFAGIQFYNQEYPPAIKPFEIAYLLMHDFNHLNQFESHGPSVWALLCLVGIVMFTVGAVSNPAEKISTMMMDELKRIRDHQKNYLDAEFSKRKYDSLAENEKELYEQSTQSYRIVQSRIIDIFSGTSIHHGVGTDASQNLVALQIEELLSRLRRRRTTVGRDSKQETDNA